MLAPYLRHQKDRIKIKNLTIKKLCNMINDIDIHILDYIDDDGIEHYKLIKIINIKPISTSKHNNDSFFTYDTFKLKLNVEYYKAHYNLNLPKDKKRQANYKPEPFLKIPCDLYETISKNVTYDDDLEDFYKLYLTTIATNTNNVTKIKRTQAEVLALLPPSWVKVNNRDTKLRLRLTNSEFVSKIDELNLVSETVKQDLETDIKLISHIDFNNQECTLYYI